ncbi:MAG: BrnT family toxin [Candidatus Schekmanbacteria bacterium]|nr:BrnT family toxin [Candidatus Schekmanbacteria bacterium]
MRYNFEWDPVKAKLNLHKHRITFQRAATVFLDPQAISVFDDEHSLEEDRWSSIGLDSEGALLVVIHTFHGIDASACNIRIISARKATKKESKQYEELSL